MIISLHIFCHISFVTDTPLDLNLWPPKRKYMFLIIRPTHYFLAYPLSLIWPFRLVSRVCSTELKVMVLWVWDWFWTSKAPGWNVIFLLLGTCILNVSIFVIALLLTGCTLEIAIPKRIQQSHFTGGLTVKQFQRGVNCKSPLVGPASPEERTG